MGFFERIFDINFGRNTSTQILGNKLLDKLRYLQLITPKNNCISLYGDNYFAELK